MVAISTESHKCDVSLPHSLTVSGIHISFMSISTMSAKKWVAAATLNIF